MTEREVTKLSKKYKTHPRTIRRWVEQDAPLDNALSMREWLQSRKHIPKGLAEKPKAGEMNWHKELKKFQALREELAYMRERGEVLPARPIQEQTAACLAILFASLERIFATEFPASCKGMDEIAIRTKALAAIEDLRADLKARFANMTKSAKQ
jgi:hypothetical protein